ncbi:MAG: NUDIX domain-containing protein [Minisyncoccia bacterium]|jgi:ADP-ribose pyrophosphatase YjhB (NUDIX family)
MITCIFEDGGKASLRHAVIDALVLKNDKILLVKRAQKFLEGGKWALVGGYMELGETIQEAVVREVFEETGYKVKDLVLLRIVDSPHRPGEDRQNISFVHYCTALGQTGVPDDENSELRWFSLNALPPESEIAFDHMENICLYREYLKSPFALPKLG